MPAPPRLEARSGVAEARLGATAACVISALVLASAAQEALFLAYHPKPRIPIAMLAGGLATGLMALTLRRLLERFPPPALLRLVLLALLAGGAGMALAVREPGSISTFTLFVFVEVAGTLSVAVAWAYFLAPLNPSAARRLLPRLGVWAGLGGLASGLAVPVLLKALAPASLVGLATAQWALALLLTTGRHARPTRERRARPAPQRLATLLASPLARSLVVTSAGLAWVGVALQYETRVFFQRSLSPAEIASAMGLLLAAAAAGGLLIQAFATERILERWGVAAGLSLLPLLVALALGVHALTPLAFFLPAALLFDKMLRPNLQRPSEACLVGALPPSVRPSLSLALSGIVAPLLKAIAAALLLALSALAVPSLVVWSALATCVGLVFMSRRWRGIYTSALEQTLREGAPGGAQAGADEELAMLDGSGARLVLEALDGAGARARDLALELLLPHRTGLVRREMLARLAHASEGVRVAALRWVAHEPSPEHHEALRARWEDASVSSIERAALLEAAGSDAPLLLGEDLPRWLDSSDLELRNVALAALLASPEPAHQETARQRLALAFQSAEPQERRAALEVIRDHARPELKALVVAALADPVETVRRAAIECLAGFADLRGRLWTLLGDPALGSLAIATLARSGPEVGREAASRLADDALGRDARLSLLRLLRLAPSRVAAKILVAQLASGDRVIRLEALKALNKLRRAERVSLEAPPIRSLIDAELGQGLHLLRCRDLLKDSLVVGSLLRRELEARIEQSREALSRALALLAPAETVYQAFRALHLPGAANRDHARELLRTILPAGPVRDGSLKLLDDSVAWSRETTKPLGLPADHAAAIAWLRATRDEWIQSALRHEPVAGGSAASVPDAEDPMQSAIETILFLKEVALFEELTNPQLAEVARLVERHDVEAGHVLFREGSPPDFMYLVRRGKLRVVQQGQEVARLGPGECVGEMAALTGGPRKATVEAVSACQLLRLDAEDFVYLLESYPGFARALLRVLVRRLARTSGPEIDTLTGMLKQQ